MTHRKETTLQDLETEAWKLKNTFLETIAPYRSDLWKYCRSLTRSPWDAEDLVQETLLKAFASLGQIWQPIHHKSYLFRIATNTWINQWRRKKLIKYTEYEEHYEEVRSAEPFAEYDVYESIELLVTKLPPKQAATILLVDVFSFTAKETAEMLATTEGAVKALLHRARNNLRLAHSKEMEGDSKQAVNKKVKTYPMPDKNVIDALIDTFHKRDPDAMAKLFSEDAHNDIVHVGQEYGREIIRNNSIKDTFLLWQGDLRAELYTLWGRPVVVVSMLEGASWFLKSILYLETEENQIVTKKEYYFCEDLLQEAGQILGLSVHPRN
ncbi:RNA polymerase sigma factor [Bacillus horti]|uniref:RNA polymerase sigma factor n=1 Tax=Caldalkalibacillus horti TaxID=77523 RepID=A0ABT9VUF5_9BACI|nr:RNA polymerase sigma factor [Bacillus horti]MDQ0164510.1 RNA polymerase sigma-70 factor (ECF subfamily) [Bacillus horti]